MRGTRPLGASRSPTSASATERTTRPQWGWASPIVRDTHHSFGATAPGVIRPMRSGVGHVPTRRSTNDPGTSTAAGAGRAGFHAPRAPRCHHHPRHPAGHCGAVVPQLPRPGEQLGRARQCAGRAPGRRGLQRGQLEGLLRHDAHRDAGVRPGCEECRHPRYAEPDLVLPPQHGRHEELVQARPRVRLGGVLPALVLGGGVMLMGRGTSDEAAAPIVIPSKKAGLLDAPAAAKKVAAKASAAAKNAGKVTPAAKAPVRLIASNGLPSRVVAQLQSHDVVIVALWGSGGKIDAMSRDEAAAGASAARAGFVPIDVIKNSREAEALTLKLGFVLRAPG